MNTCGLGQGNLYQAGNAIRRKRNKAFGTVSIQTRLRRLFCVTLTRSASMNLRIS